MCVIDWLFSHMLNPNFKASSLWSSSTSSEAVNSNYLQMLMLAYLERREGDGIEFMEIEND